MTKQEAYEAGFKAQREGASAVITMPRGKGSDENLRREWIRGFQDGSLFSLIVPRKVEAAAAH